MRFVLRGGISGLNAVKKDGYDEAKKVATEVLDILDKKSGVRDISKDPRQGSKTFREPSNSIFGLGREEQKVHEDPFGQPD